jgi:hypothetical protein
MWGCNIRENVYIKFWVAGSEANGKTYLCWSFMIKLALLKYVYSFINTDMILLFNNFFWMKLIYFILDVDYRLDNFNYTPTNLGVQS